MGTTENQLSQWEIERRKRMKVIKRYSIGGVCVVVGLILLFASMNRIKPGYTGIVYSANGGVKKQTLSQGVKFTKPFFESVNQYSTATEQAYLSKDAKEGSKDDDSFDIPTSDGKTVNVDLEFSYHFDVEKLPQTFTKFKGQNGKVIEETFIRGKIKAWSSEASSKFSVIDIFGEKRSELNAAVLKHIKPKFEEYGIVIDTINFSRIDVDAETKSAIQQRINRQQELEVAKLDKQKAEIEAEKKLIQAKAAADAKIIEAEGIAESNKKIEQSITPELLKKMEMEARIKHGWVTINGGNVITDTRD